MDSCMSDRKVAVCIWVGYRVCECVCVTGQTGLTGTDQRCTVNASALCGGECHVSFALTYLYLCLFIFSLAPICGLIMMEWSSKVKMESLLCARGFAVTFTSFRKILLHLNVCLQYGQLAQIQLLFDAFTASDRSWELELTHMPLACNS